MAVSLSFLSSNTYQTAPDWANNSPLVSTALPGVVLSHTASTLGNLGGLNAATTNAAIVATTSPTITIRHISRRCTTYRTSWSSRVELGSVTNVAARDINIPAGRPTKAGM